MAVNDLGGGAEPPSPPVGRIGELGPGRTAVLDGVTLAALAWTDYAASPARPVFQLPWPWDAILSVLTVVGVLIAGVCVVAKAELLHGPDKDETDGLMALVLATAALAFALIRWGGLPWGLVYVPHAAVLLALPFCRGLGRLPIAAAAGLSIGGGYVPRPGCDCPRCLAHFRPRYDARRRLALHYAEHLALVGRALPPAELASFLTGRAGDDRPLGYVLLDCERFRDRIDRLAAGERLRRAVSASTPAPAPVPGDWVEDVIRSCMGDGDDAGAAAAFAERFGRALGVALSLATDSAAQRVLVDASRPAG